MSFLRQNDIVNWFWRNNDLIIMLCDSQQLLDRLVIPAMIWADANILLV